MSSGSRSKKTPYAPQRERADVVESRAAFVEQQPGLNPAQLVFIDESGTHPGIGPRRGWSPSGTRLEGPEQSYARGQHVSMIAALRLDGISALMTVKGGVKGKDFRRFVLQRLVPTLRPGDIVCWDNLSLHKNRELHAAIEQAGARVVMLPKYSPDMNPIEAGWAKVKARIRQLCPQGVSDLRAAMRRGLHAIRPMDAAGWFGYCGYALPCL